MTTVAGVSGASRVVPRPPSPYVGLVPYDEDDAAFFFGRSQEVAIVSANLRSSRLTIVYGPSGVGKSSLLMAGVVHGLREEGRSSPESPFAVCAIRSWLDDPVRTLQEASRAALQELAGAELPAPRATLADSLRDWTERAGTLLLVLDQFDEYFQYHPGEGDGERLTGFAAELARVVNDPSLAVNVLISIREDAWAKLDHFEGHIPLLFANYLRIDHLDRDAAREAIEAPIAAWNRTLPSGAEPYEVEPALTAAVLVAAGGGATFAAAGETPATDASTGDRVEAPFLQLVLERLWRATVAGDGRVLTLARLEALGGARRIVENHLLEALGRLTPPEQDAASDCFRFLVSSSKTKIAHPAADLAEWTSRPEPPITAVLDKLCSGESGRILRAVAPAPDEARGVRYELFHDVLAEPILAWRRGHEEERSRRAAHRRLMRVGVASFALVAIFAALSAWALVERGHANNLVHAKQADNLALRSRFRILSAETKKKANENVAKAATIKSLNAKNLRLSGETAQLHDTRAGLDRQIASLRKGNRKLSVAISAFNKQNRGLATTINRLDTEYDRLAAQLNELSLTHALLSGDAGVLQAQAAALRAELKQLNDQNTELLRKAAALGIHTVLAAAEPTLSSAPTPPRKPTAANIIGVPGAVTGSDALRQQVEALQRQLAQQNEQRARLRDEARWLRKDNRLLAEQRDALREEIAQLETTRDGLDARHGRLLQAFAAAKTEHERLSSIAAARLARNRTRSRAVDARRGANAKLQNRNNQSVESIGGTQTTIGETRDGNRQLVNLIVPPVDKLLKAAGDTSHEPALAGLLAVEAFRVTPFDPDDAEHPGVYNALWLALSRLDGDAARNLIAPVAEPSGKVGTTRSALLVAKICGLVTRGLTQDEWKQFLPPSAPYTSRPCP